MTLDDDGASWREEGDGQVGDGLRGMGGPFLLAGPHGPGKPGAAAALPTGGSGVLAAAQLSDPPALPIPRCKLQKPPQVIHRRAMPRPQSSFLLQHSRPPSMLLLLAPAWGRRSCRTLPLPWWHPSLLGPPSLRLRRKQAPHSSSSSSPCSPCHQPCRLPPPLPLQWPHLTTHKPPSCLPSS